MKLLHGHAPPSPRTVELLDAQMRAGYVWSRKYDGQRLLLDVPGRTAYGKSGVTVSRMRRLYPFLAALPEGCVLDGELVYYDESGVERRDLLRRSDLPHTGLHYVIHDVLVCGGAAIHSEPFFARRSAAHAIHAATCGAPVSVATEGAIELLWRASHRYGWEGVVGKPEAAGYLSGGWLKVKRR